MSRAHSAVIVLVGMSLVCFSAQARADDEPEIAVEADATEIYIGEGVDYIVEVRNAKNPPAPDLSALRPAFDAVATGDESRNQSSTFIINGRLSQQNTFGHAYRFRLTPKRAGRLVIPGPSVTIDGKTISGRSLPLNVIAPEPQDLVIAEIRTDRETVYPTQPFEVLLRVLVRPLPDDVDRDPLAPLRRRPPHLDVNWVELPQGLTGDDRAHWLESMLAENETGFTLNDVSTRGHSFFDGPRLALFSLYHGREKRKGLDGRPVNYFVYELKRRLSAEKAGTYELGPAVVKGTFVDAKEGDSYSGRRLVIAAPKVRVEVREVPVPRPATYCGGIGDYRLSASASPTSIRVGDPVTLSLEIKRGDASGSLDLISAPDLAANPRIAADFEILDKTPTGRKEGDVKRFEYALRPKRAGVAIPPVAVSVFNPDTEKFSDVASQPIALTVTAGTRVNTAELVGSLPGSASPGIKSRAQGIYQNVIDPSELYDERIDLRTLIAITVASWCGVGGLTAIVLANRQKAGDVVRQRKRHARRTADRKLAEARKALAEGRTNDAIRSVRSALVGLVADMCNVVFEGLTASEAAALLARTALSTDERSQLARLLEAIESADYGAGLSSECPAMIDTAAKLIPSLARHLERGV